MTLQSDLNETKTSVSQLCIKAFSIYDYSQLSELQEELSDGAKQPILIIRITPLLLKEPEEGRRLIDNLYSTAMENNYSVFRLGEERIIVVPYNVQVERRSV